MSFTLAHLLLLTVEVRPVDLVEQEVELRRLGLHGAAVQSHAHLGLVFFSL